MYGAMQEFLRQELAAIREAGLYKTERVLVTPQGAGIRVQCGSAEGGTDAINFCANNYLGLSSHPDLIAACHGALDEWGYGLSSVRFICGTQDIHKQLERRIAEFLGMDDAILYSSCFDANGGLFETLFKEEDAILSDELNHASIIDGVRLSKAQRFRYRNADMADLEAQLRAAAGARFRVVATDGVFSMDGTIAPVGRICDLAEKHDALVMVDDSHATGFVGKSGRGTHEYHGAMGRVDIITSTLGKALGGASGGFTAGRREVIDLLRNRSRPYLFSNTLPPPIAGAALSVLDLLTRTTERRDRLEANTRWFREQMQAKGFAIPPGDHPIVPILLGDAKLAADMARDLLEEGIYVIGFSYPVVPKGKARIRVQVSAAHEPAHLEQAVAAFEKIGRRHGVIA
jgi:glycine C-acetyltransferase